MGTVDAGLIYGDVRRAARDVATAWPGVIEADDAEQEIWAKLMESRDYVRQVTDMDPPDRYNALRRIGTQVAAQYREDYARFSGQVHYGTEEVKALLEGGALTRGHTDTATERLDLGEGLELLRKRNQGYADALVEAYLLGTYPLVTGAGRKRLSRARLALTQAMNNVHRNRRTAYQDGPGTREVLSNDTARYVTSRPR
ncbi:hypothetical protein GCM10012275_15260 [Longimycelium tulufanense]|uniref:Uncharacterized protein n=1 Tax=Longimycelium tulufanense TaxID=907463 RepID=A0A8J3FUP7_9PSEU|nr:hypothetical protein [Longimycelium tulufanense]GGM45154.1 hypothetical protein GCM10012275_15260 [Longimycelium tulufanense]